LVLPAPDNATARGAAGPPLGAGPRRAATRVEVDGGTPVPAAGSSAAAAASTSPAGGRRTSTARKKKKKRR